MIDYKKILKENPNGVMATYDGKMVKTRMFQYLFSDENKVYFCTNTKKPVFSQMQQHPYVSFCTNLRDFTPVLSVNGKVTFVDDIKLKQRAMDENPGLIPMYGNASNPVFAILYIDVEEIETFSYDEGPQKYRL